jgi:glycerol-3-phosphate acyltransferase PlsY
MNDYFWLMMCMFYLIGGMTLGWWFTKAYQKTRDKKTRTGTGRWDVWKPGDEDTFK